MNSVPIQYFLVPFGEVVSLQRTTAGFVFLIKKDTLPEVQDRPHCGHTVSVHVCIYQTLLSVAIQGAILQRN